MAFYISIFLNLLTISILVILLIRFKKLFSTQHILEKTQNYMNKMITDLNNQANRDLDLINASKTGLQDLLRKSENQMEKFNQATDRLRNMIAEAEKTASGSKPVIYQTNKYVENIPAIKNKKKTNDKPLPDPNAAYAVKKQQNSLFDEDESPSIIKDETIVTPEGAALKEVPLIITKIYDDTKIATPEQKQKSLSQKVQMLHDAGHGVEEIANELSCSITEVQLIIDML